jgi:hypothetical protein
MKKRQLSQELYGVDKESDKAESDKTNMITENSDTDKSLLLRDLRRGNKRQTTWVVKSAER